MARKEKYITKNKNKHSSYLTVAFYYYDRNGERKHYSKSFNIADYDTESECMEAACDHRDLKRALLVQKKEVEPCHITVADLWNEFPNAFPLKASTLKGYSYTYKNWIEPYYANSKIIEITPYEINESLNRAVYSMSNHSLSRFHTLWKKLFHLARLKFPDIVDITDLTKIPKSQKKVMKKKVTVSDEDLNKIVTYLQNTGRTEQRKYNNMIISYALLIMRFTGMRPQECFALNRKNVSDDFITITEAVSLTHEGKYDSLTVKTPASLRDIPLSSQCKNVINNLREFTKNEYMLKNYKGEFFNMRKLSSYISEISKKLGIKFSMYNLRHQAPTDMLALGVDLRTVQEIMGHTSATMSIYYARSNDKLKKNALEKLGDCAELDK